MEKAESPGNTETPGPAVDQDPDFVAGLDRHQKNFQTILLEIVKKYDHPFKNDTVFDFGRVTHTRTGKCIWKYKAFQPEHGTSEDEEHVSETDSDKARLAPCKKTSCGGNFQDLKIPCDKPETKSSQHSKKKLSTTSKTSEDFVDEEHVREANVSQETQLAPCKKTSLGGKFQDLKIPCDKPETKSSQHSKKKLSTTSKVPKFSDQTGNRIMHCREENPSASVTDVSQETLLAPCKKLTISLGRRCDSPEASSSQDSKKKLSTTSKKTLFGGKFQEIKIPCDSPKASSSQHSKKKLSITSKKTSFAGKCQDIKIPCDSPEASSSHDSKNKLSTTSKVPKFSDQTGNTIMHCREENPSASDHKGIVSTYRNDLRIISKSICFTHSLKSSEQVNRLNDKTNKARVLDYPRRGCRTPCEADDSRLPIDESEMASKACDSRLFHKESGLGKPINILNPSSFLQTYKLNSMACPVNLFSDSPITANKAFEGVSVNQTVCNVGPFAGQKLKEINGIMPPGWSSSGLSNSRNMAINSPEGVTNSSQIDTNISQFQCYKDYTPQQNIQSVSKRNRPSLFSMLQSPNTLVANSRKMSINSPEGVTNSSQIDTNLSQFQCYKDYTPQLDIQPVSKRNRPSLFSMLQSPNASVAKLNCSMHDKIKTLSKTMTAQSQMEVDERNHAIFKIHMEQLQNRPCSLSKGHSFSAFPVARSTNQDFDSVCTQAQSQPVDKGQVHLSKTVSSLVNSPGSLKAKRPLKHDFSFSPSKKPRSVTEAIIGTSKAFSPDHNKTLLSSKEQRFFPPQHSVVASPPPSDLSPYSGYVTRFIPPNTYGITPKRFARYRKLVYEENCTNPGNE